MLIVPTHAVLSDAVLTRTSLKPIAAALALPMAMLMTHAQAQPTSSANALEEVVVTATRTEQRLEDVLADVSVLDRSDIERAGATGLADLLVRLPGVEISRNGGPGTTTSVFLRGAETRYTAVFIDGVRVDSQSTGGAPWEAIPLSMIERVEVLRGPAAAVYGSDAIGGVIQIFTKRGQAGMQPSVAVGVGNQGTRDAAVGISGAANGWDYSVSGAHERSSGFNARVGAAYNPDKDGYRRSSGQAKLGYQINEQHRVQGSVLSSYLNSGYDSSLTADDRNKHRMHAVNLSWQARWSERYRSTFSVSDSSALYETSPSVYRTDTDIRSYLFHNEYRVGKHVATVALERREDRLKNAPIDKMRYQNALALGYGWQVGAHTMQANVRYDDDSEFGGETTGSFAYGLALSSQWRLKASVARAFRAPTLYQRFSEYGVGSLSPETSNNVEAGISYANGVHQASLTAYRNTVKNLISFGGAGPCASAFGCYENTAKARYQGATLAGETRVADVRWYGSVDIQNPKDLTSGNLLARRAKRHASLGAEFNWTGWLLGTEAQASSMRYDTIANTTRLGGYTLWNLTASRALGDDWLLSARVNNVADKQYALARTYATAGRTVYVNLRWAPTR